MSEQELRDLKYKLKEFIESNDIGGVFVGVKRVLPQESPKIDLLISIESQYNTWRNKQAKGVLSFEENTLYENRIKDSLLAFINGLSTFDFKISKNPITEERIFPLLHRIDCDRKEVVAQFKARLHEKEGCGCACQHYFLLSPRRQHPHSVVERLIYDLEADGNKIRYEQSGRHNILINPLPAHSNLSQGKLELKKLIRKKFGHHCEQLGELLQAKPHLDEHDYIVKVLRLNINDDWHEHSLELFQWFIEDFCTLQSSSNTKFLFFYIIHTDATKPKGFFQRLLASKDKSAILRKELVSLQSKCSDICTILPTLNPVRLEDFEQWVFDKITKNDFQSKRKVKEIINGLSADERKDAFVTKDGLCMSFVEAQIKELIGTK